MKRIQYACLNQTIRFKAKDGTPESWAQRVVQEECAAYKRELKEKNIPHRILSEKVQEDGSIVIRIKRGLMQYDVGDYLEE